MRAGGFDRLLVGRTLAGRYHVGEVIGRGGMSVVYRAEDERLDRPVALKVIALEADSPRQRAELRERFRREAASAARLSHHPGIVQVHDYGTDAELDLDFIVMELLRGRDLKAVLAGGPLPPDRALRIVERAARGIEAGHRHGIVHRDVKPANFFLVDGGRGDDDVRVLDFGIARALEGDDELTRTGHLPHSPAYAAPEQTVPGHAPPTPAADVFGLGMVACEALSGERPFGDEERARLRGGEDVPLPERGRWRSVPPPVRAVVERALRARPEDRYSDAGEFADALASAATPSDRASLVEAAPVRPGEATAVLNAEPDEDSRPDETMLAPPPHLGAPFPTAELPDGVAVERAPQNRRGQRRLASAAPWLALLLVLALVAAWALTRGPREATDAEAAVGAVPEAAPATLPVGEPDAIPAAERERLHDAFVRLQAEVASEADTLRE